MVAALQQSLLEATNFFGMNEDAIDALIENI